MSGWDLELHESINFEDLSILIPALEAMVDLGNGIKYALLSEPAKCELYIHLKLPYARVLTKVYCQHADDVVAAILVDPVACVAMKGQKIWSKRIASVLVLDQDELTPVLKNEIGEYTVEWLDSTLAKLLGPLLKHIQHRNRK